MSALAIALVVFVCVFGAALLGLFLRSVLPRHHLSEESTNAVKLGSGLIATLAALVLGLLIASGKNSFDRINDEFTQTAAKVALLDHTLARYGPETKEARDLVRNAYASAMELLFSGERTGVTKLDAPERATRLDQVQDKLRALTPRDELQRELQTRAVDLSNELVQLRWLVIAQGEGAIPPAFLVVLVIWLAIIFVGFGLLSTRNATVVVTLLLCALSVAGSVFLIEEMNHPFGGLITISSDPAREVLMRLAQ